MNIVSIMVGMSLMGAAAPIVMDMSLQPVIAQKRATHLGNAEALAVSYAAANEGQPTLVGAVPDACTRAQDPDSPDAYTISCSSG
jgi:hypothetical protein